MSQDGPGDHAVTKIVDRVPRPGQDAALEQAIHDLIEAALAFPGHLGVTVTRPAPPTQPGFRVVYRFDTCDHLRAWEESAVYARLAAAANAFTQGEPIGQTLKGLETWITLPGSPPATPRWRLAVVSWLGIYPLVTVVGWLAGLALPASTPWPLRAFAVTAIVVPSMIYLAAPQLTRLFRAWLNPRA